jgi:hypothetical protein
MFCPLFKIYDSAYFFLFAARAANAAAIYTRE